MYAVVIGVWCVMIVAVMLVVCGVLCGVYW